MLFQLYRCNKLVTFENFEIYVKIAVLKIDFGMSHLNQQLQRSHFLLVQTLETLIYSIYSYLNVKKNSSTSIY